jgi:hypothetical protein
VRAAPGIDVGIFVLAELDAVLVIEVAHDAPRRLAHERALLGRHAELGRALLKLDGIAAGDGRGGDQLLGDSQVAVMVDAYLGDDETWSVITHRAGPDCHGRHESAPNVQVDERLTRD